VTVAEIAPQAIPLPRDLFALFVYSWPIFQLMQSVTQVSRR